MPNLRRVSRVGSWGSWGWGMTGAILVAGLVGAGGARADALEATLKQPLFEVSHSVDVSIDDGVAVYKVQRVFANPGTVADEVSLDVDLPYGAAATGLRIRARDVWYAGELMEAQKAAELYHELTGLGAWEPKDPALLQWVWADKLHLQIFPVMPGGTSTVEYTLTVPTRYQGGHVYVSYPRLSRTAQAGLAVPVLRLRPAWGDARTSVVIDGVRAAPDAPLVLAAPVEPAWAGAIERDASASYVASVIDVPASAATKGPFTTAKVTLELEHTYKGDVRIELVTPGGKAIEIFNQAGSGDNDVRGTFPIKLPAAETGAGVWRLVVSDHVARDAGTLARWSLELPGQAGKKAHSFSAADTPLFVPDAPENASDAGVAVMQLGPPKIDVVAARLGRVVASDKHAFLRLELDTAPVLRALPRKAQVVFVLDASHSIGEAGIAAQLRLARAYLAHVPDAEVQLVAYRRRAEALSPSFVSATKLDALLAALRKDKRLEPGNGSALEDGARVAAEQLKGRAGERRIVLLTDALLRKTFDQAVALKALARAPAGTVVHLVEPSVDGDSAELTRKDDHALAALASKNHGIAATMAGLVEASDKAVVAEVLGLVRPIRIDHFKASAKGLGDDKLDAPDPLKEGDGARTMIGLASAPSEVVLTGQIWGDPWKRVVKVDGAFSKATAAFVFGEDEHHDLSDAEMMKVAMFGRAVSPVTSYLATEPGVRPSTIGLDRDMLGAGGTGSGSGMGYGGGSGRVRRPPSLYALINQGAKKCIEKAAGTLPQGWAVTLEVETTLDEVVDVVTTEGAKLPVATCLAEVVWAVRLTADFDDLHEDFTLAFP